MAQKTFVDGDVLTASDINTYLMGEGGAWTSWTPTVTQTGTVTATVTYSKYARYGRTIIWNFALEVTGSGTGSSSVVITLPVTAASGSGVRGAGAINDTSTATNYGGAWLNSGSTTSVSFVSDATGNSFWGTTPTTALASGDVLSGTIIYEAAS